MPQIPDDEIPEGACHGVVRRRYTGKRKEYSARGSIDRNIKSVIDVAFNILTKSGANNSSRLGATSG